MIRTLDEILEDVRALGDEVVNSDSGVTLIENITDTLKATVTSDDVEKAKKEVADEWRKKYVDRFYNKDEKADDIEEPDEVDETEETYEKYEDLFVESEE